MAGYTPNSSHQDFAAPPQPIAWTFNHPPTTGCSPTNWALSTHEPDCQSCNISGMFLAIQSDIPFGHKRKIKTPSISWFWKWKKTSLLFANLWPHTLAKQNLTILFNSPMQHLPAQVLCKARLLKKSHINNQTTSKIWHSTTSHKNNNLSGLLQAIKPLTQV